MEKAELERLLAALPEGEATPRRYPVAQWNPPLSGEIDIRIAADGRWYHEGEEIRREGLIRLFASLLRREGSDYFLVTPAEKWRIRVDDVPFLVVRMEPLRGESGQALVFWSNVGDRVVAGPEHPLRVVWAGESEVRPYLLVRDGLEGRLARPVYYQLAELAEPGPPGREREFGVYSQGVFFPLT